MKFLHIIHSTNPTGGGPIEGLKQLAEATLQMGHHTEVLTIDAPGSVWLDSMPFTVHAVGPGKGQYGYAPRLVPWLKQHASEFDAVFVRGIWQYHSFGSWSALRNTTVPYFVFTHGMLDPWFKRTYPLKHAKKWLYWPWADYRVLRDADAVLFTCEEERVLARKSFWLYRCKETVVNYGTTHPAGNAADQKRAFFGRHPELQSKRLALFLGRVHPKKGCDLLIKAFAKELSHDPNWRLVIAGPDQDNWKAELIKIAHEMHVSEAITWTEMISGDIKYGAIHASEVFVLPSHQENFGIAVAEALACGKPALISNKVNIWREIEQDGAGIVANDDFGGTCELLRRWVGLSGNQQQHMSQQAVRCFGRRFEIHQSANSLVRLVSGLRPASNTHMYEQPELASSR